MKYFFTDKPAGATTHTSLADRSSIIGEINDGFCEYLSSRFQVPLFVSHRLDRDTTGTLVFARDTSGAEELRVAFAERKVQKRYLFLTDRAAKTDHFVVESNIERRGSIFVSSPVLAGEKANARTNFQKIAETQNISLWEAKPETGRPHQIRLHASSQRIPLLGDEKYGGSQFPQLCLHSEFLGLKIDGIDYQSHSPAPRWFLNRELALDHVLVRWLAAVDRRERLLRTFSTFSTVGDTQAGGAQQCHRWIHSEGDPLRVEQLGDVHWLSWFREQEPSKEDFLRIERLAQELNWQNWTLQLRQDRGRTPQQQALSHHGTPPSPQWLGKEGELQFEFRSGQGLSPGLFLDQRQNRNWVLKNANNKKVLNLFCYTGGFSVAAAKGGAAKVVSVDLSKVFLEWAKKNFALNNLSTEPHEFRSMDSRDYLAWAKKKQLKFDLVICDPPSFSRSDKGIFKIERDLEDLLQALIDVTDENGLVLFSSNFEGWDAETLENRIRSFIQKQKGSRIRLARTPSPDWDFELPTAQRNMKSLFLSPLTSSSNESP